MKYFHEDQKYYCHMVRKLLAILYGSITSGK